MIERELQLDRYRMAVERYLGDWLKVSDDEDFAQFFAHVERCFDWGVHAAACARAWLAKVAAGHNR